MVGCEHLHYWWAFSFSSFANRNRSVPALFVILYFIRVVIVGTCLIFALNSINGTGHSISADHPPTGISANKERGGQELFSMIYCNFKL